MGGLFGGRGGGGGGGGGVKGMLPPPLQKGMLPPPPPPKCSLTAPPPPPLHTPMRSVDSDKGIGITPESTFPRILEFLILEISFYFSLCDIEKIIVDFSTLFYPAHLITPSTRRFR